MKLNDFIENIAYIFHEFSVRKYKIRKKTIEKLDYNLFLILPLFILNKNEN